MYFIICLQCIRLDTAYKYYPNNRLLFLHPKLTFTPKKTKTMDNSQQNKTKSKSNTQKTTTNSARQVDVDVDTYDRGIIPAETAARKEREGESFKTLPTEEGEENLSSDEQKNTEGLRTTDGYTVDNEGLLNNYAIEPEMYYEVPGDAREENKTQEEKQEDKQ